MSGDDAERNLPSEPSDKGEAIVPAEPAPKVKHPEISDIFQTIQALQIEDLADKRVVAILIQVLNEKLDRIRILEAEISRLREENKGLSIDCAKQSEQLRVAKGSHVLWTVVGVLGGLLAAGSLSVMQNTPIFLVMLVSGIILSLLGALGART